eukprot:TRINITY_DN11146_c0_g1_i4.p3 TRINITY_DN11146_c0_g1~~TRINITY_DN11146_c0_g1_i4.p3  ORF type:complete len:178 (+),score=40.78 TRINITY_DN11146_c0_g1_i4:423-956(+)
MQEEESKAKARAAFIKRKDREEEVKRMARINEYRKEQILERIYMDDERVHRLKEERSNLINARHDLRARIGTQKARINSAFEKVKTGHSNPNELKKLQNQVVRSTIAKSEQRPTSVNARQPHRKNSFKGIRKKTRSTKRRKENKNTRNAIPLGEAVEKVKELRSNLYSELISVIEQE